MCVGQLDANLVVDTRCQLRSGAKQDRRALIKHSSYLSLSSSRCALQAAVSSGTVRVPGRSVLGAPRPPDVSRPFSRGSRITGQEAGLAGGSTAGAGRPQEVPSDRGSEDKDHQSRERAEVTGEEHAVKRGDTRHSGLGTGWWGMLGARRVPGAKAHGSCGLSPGGFEQQRGHRRRGV